jgi:hypothetical protein
MRTARAPLGIERLEARDTPAGNISATVSGGVLFLNGDGADNQFGLQQNASGDVFVYGLNGTSVNGQPVVLVGRGIPNAVVADLGTGNDYFEILGLLAGGVSINGGNGFNSIAMANVRTAGNIEYRGGQEDDAVFMAGVVAGNQMILDGGNGTDSLRLDRSGGINGTFIFNFDRGF